MNIDNNANIEKFVAFHSIKYKKQIEELRPRLLQEMKLLKKSEKPFSDFSTVAFQKGKDASNWMNLIAGMCDRYTVSESFEDLAFFTTSSFLSLFEVGYLTYVDLICLLLVKNGHDLYNRGGYCSNFDDIGLVDTNAKFCFLKEHGLSSIIRDEDRKLRNTIAHLNFKINKDTILINNNASINIGNRFKDLGAFVAVLAFETAKTVQLLDETT